MTLRIHTIIGARPQFIKAGALSRTLKKYPGIIETIVHTGQHFDTNMSDVFFKELDIPKPQYSMNINSGSHGQMTGRMLEGIEAILKEDKPDAVLVYGDTNSTLSGALSASKLHIPVIHIEAGLRSFNRKMPEEINRILTDHVSDYLFCPTQTAVDNLHNEAIKNGVYHVGDIMYDATLYAMDYIKTNFSVFKKFMGLPEKFAFMTMHRAESTESMEEFQSMMDYALRFAKNHNLRIIFSVHPRTKALVQKAQLDDTFITVEPLRYFETQYCLSKAHFVLTDSGGLQKEAYFYRVPCITLRQETEWVETIECGWNRLWTVENYKLRKDITDYGDGDCAEEIINLLLEEFL
ncbi:non-hydrolyzing UDP-N-acetylglucosamine 2-epimerase [Holospora curviuscula]|uniref:UDP-2,3-diacetamido-2,3-dideoxy-D-glucuronate 2-epimerase n=1 Tax=Holospora curviuscula TaxID=1082868 RepID=A0A2S5R726_9PROT|nr:UDP-N-acetylglucosamine 2-epimerase (non-hydrolyzing) [Holospora curviuscula]PPE03141.1 UDP-2,3-diacetamido-2,3-dideoxy-D-glucuronate 2-epimerase [Holospora curviuscula]